MHTIINKKEFELKKKKAAKLEEFRKRKILSPTTERGKESYAEVLKRHLHEKLNPKNVKPKKQQATNTPGSTQDRNHQESNKETRPTRGNKQQKENNRKKEKNQTDQKKILTFLAKGKYAKPKQKSN